MNLEKIKANKKIKKLNESRIFLPKSPVYCKICFKEIKDDNFIDFFRCNGFICYDCYLKLCPYLKKQKFENVSITRLYLKNEFLTGLVFQYCKGNDYELKNIFLSYYGPYLRSLYKYYEIYYLKTQYDNIGDRQFLKSKEIYSPLRIKEIKNIKDLQENSKILIVGIASEYHQNYLESISYFEKFKPKKIEMLLLY